jgi:diguanylate cyclase (GGDEF)-like protein
VDHFKRTNDVHGPDAGDAVLCEIADRLKDTTGATDVSARLGGDEFAVLLREVRNEDELEVAVATIRLALRAPFAFGGAVLECGASIGGSVTPVHGLSSKQLLKSADVALYTAKAAGRGNFRSFKPKMLFERERQQTMLTVAQDSLDQGLIVPFYQPKVEIASGRIIGFEALLRWRHHTKGIQAPDTLAAAFLDGVLAPRLSERIISSVITDMKMWKAHGIDVGHVALNAAAADFAKGDFADCLLERLHKASLPFSSIQIEVTEAVFLGRGSENVEVALRMLNAAGVRVALDDFGTGYASLSHLTEFPIDIIKIDRSFVGAMECNSGKRTIVEAVVALGRSLGIDVVAEGVETVMQHAALEAIGCPVGQGFLYGKAGPSSDVAATLCSALNSAEKWRFIASGPGRKAALS